MLNFTFTNRVLLILAVLIGFTTACKKKEDDPQPTAPVAKGFRKPMDYGTLTAATSYRTAFLDEAGDSTVDRNEGRARLRMFRALATYMTSSISGNKTIDKAKLNNLFANTNRPFESPYADLNDLKISIKEVTASSKANQASVHEDLAEFFAEMARVSTEGAEKASKGVAGKDGNYLLDEGGIEPVQIIQKSLIGAYQLDYISNVLLNTGLNADNTGLVAGKKYTALEHNWDVAYGFLTMNDRYYDGTTDQKAAKLASELYLGSYVWEYNKSGFVQLHTAFLKGRAAIVNNDMAEVKAQAAIIRQILEYTIGSSAKGYMVKSSGAPHAFAEGLGFIYSTRFCSVTGADDAFAQELEDDLFGKDENTVITFYDITATQYTTVSNKLVSKFKLQ